jgi:transposase InsO family protein
MFRAVHPSDPFAIWLPGEISSVKVLKPRQKRLLVKDLCVGYKVGQKRASQVPGFNRSTYYYRSRTNPQTELRIRLKELAAARVRYGSRRLHILLMREGWKINHQRVYRLYKEEGQNLRLKNRGRGLVRQVYICLNRHARMRSGAWSLWLTGWQMGSHTGC